MYRTKGIELLRPIYSRRHGAEWVQYQDIVPTYESLRGEDWLESGFDRWVTQFFTNQTDFGLVPISGRNAPPQPNAYYACQDFGRISPLKAVVNIARLVRWNNKPQEVKRVRDYIEQVFSVHRYRDLGWYYGVDAYTGVAAADNHNITSYGNLYEGLFRLGMLDEAQQVSDVVLRCVSARGDYALPERWTAYGPLLRDWSSDGCYFVRSLEESEMRLEFSKSYSGLYFSQQWGHSTTHRDGDSWYSDGIVNQLVMHVLAGRLDRFDSCWRVLQRESVGGLIPAMVTNGKGNGQPHSHQELALEALVERAEATGLASDIYEAKRFADLLLSRNAWSKDEQMGRELLRLSSLLRE